MLPVNEEFLNSQGKDYGAATPSGILYNGTIYFEELHFKISDRVRKKNTKLLRDKDNVKIDHVKLTFYDGSDQESLIR